MGAAVSAAAEGRVIYAQRATTNSGSSLCHSFIMKEFADICGITTLNILNKRDLKIFLDVQVRINWKITRRSRNILIT